MAGSKGCAATAAAAQIGIRTVRIMLLQLSAPAGDSPDSPTAEALPTWNEIRPGLRGIISQRTKDLTKHHGAAARRRASMLEPFLSCCVMGLWAVAGALAQTTPTTTRTLTFPPFGLGSSETARINLTNVATASSSGTAA